MDQLKTKNTCDSDSKRMLAKTSLPSAHHRAKTLIKADMMQQLHDLDLDPVWLCALKKQYTVTKVLGSGAFGVVVSALSKN